MTVDTESGTGIVGRDSELAAVEWFLDASGQGPALLDLVGEPGIGKTTLLVDLCDRARTRGHLVRIARPTPAEASFSYAAVGDLIGDVLDATPELHDALPEPQRWALDVALLRASADGRPVEMQLVAAALRSVLVRLAADRPVLVVVDDLQWLDRASESVLRFAFRRLAGLPIGLATARRPPTSPERETWLVDPRTPGVDHRALSLSPLSLASLYRLVASRLDFEPTRRQLDRIQRLSAGNPFYALELARSLRDAPPGTEAHLADDAAGALQAVLLGLPIPTRDALLRAAAHRSPTGLEVPLGDLDPAERAGIVAIDETGRVAFTHPTWALTVYDSASASRRRAAHRALASLVTEPEEQARHRALGSDGPDEEVATALELAADRAEARGAAEAAADLGELAIRLTPDGRTLERLRRRLRWGRLLALTDLARARTVLDGVVADAPSGRERAEALLELGIVVWNLGDVAQGIRYAEEALENWDDRRFAGLVHARLSWARSDRVDQAADEARLALESLDPETDPELAGFAMLHRAQWDLLAGRGADQAAFDAAIDLEARSKRVWLTSTVPATWAKMLDDFDGARGLYRRYLREVEEAGDDLGAAANIAHLAEVACRTGEWDEAERLAGQALEIATSIGSSSWVAVALHPSALVAALRGRHDEARAKAARIFEIMGPEPDAVIEAHARSVLGLIALIEGDPAETDRELTRADECLTEMGMVEPAPFRFHGDHVEAVVALGDLERAEVLVQRLESRREMLPKPWTRVMAARGRGLVLAARGDLDAAEASFRSALEAQKSLGMPFEGARNALLLGLLLRRRRRRTEAAALLNEALATFQRLGAKAWASHTTGELERLGVRAGDATLLTPSEDRIARLAGSGLTNKEIASRLLISPKTVEANLSRAYEKLGIRTRAELGRWAADDGPAASP